jgi:predicted AlkP superfamily pyrophosphatase or phosphodiesterase
MAPVMLATLDLPYETEQTAMPDKLLFIILDGCRPDALQQADTPTLDSLWQGGAVTWQGRSIMPSITLPAHNSMFRSVLPEVHGVTENVFNPVAAATPSFIDAAALAGKQCAMFFSWEYLRDLGAPGSLRATHYRYGDYGEDNDTPIALAAADYLVEAQPDLLILYMGDVDIHGHLYGWMSPEYLGAIEMNDRAVGQVLARLEAAGLREAYHVLVLADHGGHDTDHGTDRPEDMLIPLILNGRRIRPGHTLQSPVSLLDVAPTVAQVLGFPPPAAWQGQALMEAFREE